MNPFGASKGSQNSDKEGRRRRPVRGNVVALLLLLLGVVGVVAAIWLLAGYPWAIGVLGTLALIAGALLFDPDPPRPIVYPNNRGVR